MRLRVAKAVFDRLRKDPGRIVPLVHAYRDHPERRFTAVEIVALVQGRGVLKDNKMPTAQPESFLWMCKDVADRRCELVVRFEALDSRPNELVLVVSAWRAVR